MAKIHPILKHLALKSQKYQVQNVLIPYIAKTKFLVGCLDFRILFPMEITL